MSKRSTDMPESTTEAENIVIVGGGITGLVAARALAASSDQLNITLLESGSTFGGLAAGMPLCGTSIEKAYHYLLTGDTEALRLIDELGLTDKLLYRAGSVGIFYNGKIYPFTTALDLLRFSPCTLIERFRLALAMLRLQRTEDWRPLASQTAQSWLERTCGPGVMRIIWNPLLRGKFDKYWDKVSMSWLWARIHTRANSRGRGRELLAYPRGGFASITQAIETELRSAGVSLRANSRVEKIDTNEGRHIQLADGEVIPFDRCLFTGPCDAFARVLPAEASLDNYRQQLESIKYLGAICVVFVSEQNLGENHWVNIHDMEAPFLVMLNHTALLEPSLYQGKYVYYLGCYRPHDSEWFAMEDNVLLEKWFDYFGLIFPEFNAAQISEKHVFRFRNAQHVVDCDYAERIPDFRTPLDRVYLANFAQIFPHDRGTNFAVRDGLKLANMIIDDLTPPPDTKAD
jgi:protoporphyrinogen oxidase